MHLVVQYNFSKYECQRPKILGTTLAQELYEHHMLFHLKGVLHEEMDDRQLSEYHGVVIGKWRDCGRK